MNENVIEWIRNEERATVTFSQGRYVTKIKRLAEKSPDECEIVAENKDGSVVAHIPVKWVKIGPPRAISEEQRAKARERLNAYRADSVSTSCEKEQIGAKNDFRH